MLYKLSFVLLLAALTCGQIASAQISQSGKCPDVKLVEDFKWPSFEGVWYEYAKYPDSVEDGVECVYSKFAIINNETIAVQFFGVKANNQPATLDVVGNILGPGTFSVTNKKYGIKQTNKIIGYENKSWAVIYSCDNVGDKRSENAWILTNEPHPKEEIVGKAMAVLTQNGISTKSLTNTRQDGCPAHIKHGNKKTNLLGSLKKWLLP